VARERHGLKVWIADRRMSLVPATRKKIVAGVDGGTQMNRSIEQMRPGANCMTRQMGLVFRGRSSGRQNEKTDERMPT
jgi:hypothetical protein